MTHTRTQGSARTEGWVQSARPPVCFGGAVRALPGQMDRAKKKSKQT